MSDIPAVYSTQIHAAYSATPKLPSISQILSCYPEKLEEFNRRHEDKIVDIVHTRPITVAG